MRYLSLLIVLCGCVREIDPEPPVPSDLKTLAETQPALLVSRRIATSWFIGETTCGMSIRLWNRNGNDEQR